MVRQHSTSTDLFAHFPLMLQDMDLTYLKHDGSHLIIQLKRRKSRIKTAFGLEEPFYLE